MKRVGAAALVVFICGVATARAADSPQPILYERVPAGIWAWTGLYAGVHVGGGFGLTQFKHQPPTAIYGDSVRSPLALGGVQVGYNWQVPDTSFVLGVEADASAVGSDGTNTCLAISGAFLSANCQVRQSFIGSVAARAGYAVGPDQRTLLFVKGGAAALNQAIDITTNGAWPPASVSTKGTRIGWLAGLGVERALTPAWSLKLEYDYLDFGTEKVSTPASYLQAIPGANAYFPVPAGTADARHNVHAVKLGVNVRLGEDSHATWPLRGAVQDTSPRAEIEIGTRVWYSFGRHQKDLGGSTLQGAQNYLVSRLTYETSSYSGEVFGRVDADNGFFVKGFGGAGRSASGKMHDEDWLIFGNTVPYSNTLSSPVKETLAYATFDVGYALFRGANAKLGGFIGYNYMRDNNSAYGCTQIATPDSVCTPPIPNSILVITQNNDWHSLRVGLNGVVSLGGGITLTGDAAYLPAVSFTGVDNHLLRTDVSDTVSREKGFGHGVQLEALLAYAFNQSFSVGAGGRYWAMWANDGALTNIFGTACPCQTLPSRTERYGGFVQASYKFDGLK